MIKRIISYVLVASFAFLTISPLQDVVEAKTLKQYKNEVAALEAKHEVQEKTAIDELYERKYFQQLHIR